VLERREWQARLAWRASLVIRGGWGAVTRWRLGGRGGGQRLRSSRPCPRCWCIAVLAFGATTRCHPESQERGARKECAPRHRRQHTGRARPALGGAARVGGGRHAMARARLHPAAAEIMTNGPWLAALRGWDRAGGRPIGRGELPRGLEPRLLETGWFDGGSGRLMPSSTGSELLWRAREVANLRDLDARGALPHELMGPGQGAALEIGCGTGHCLLLLARAGYDPLYGYDLSPLALQIAEFLLGLEGRTGPTQPSSRRYPTTR
jgi:hypothetical protein